MDLIMQPLFQDKGLMVPYLYFNLIIDLPDGMYTVKTFHDQPEPHQRQVYKDEGWRQESLQMTDDRLFLDNRETQE